MSTLHEEDFDANLAGEEGSGGEEARSNRFGRITKKIIQNFGSLVRKYNPATSEELRRIKLLQHYNVDLVFDIGANIGQYAGGIIDAGYLNKIVSFEPLSSAYSKIERNITDVGFKRLTQIAKAFGVTVVELLSVSSKPGEQTDLQKLLAERDKEITELQKKILEPLEKKK